MTVFIHLVNHSNFSLMRGNFLQVQIGIERGMDACQYQMQNNRWNCSQLSKESFQQLMQEGLFNHDFISFRNLNFDKNQLRL